MPDNSLNKYYGWFTVLSLLVGGLVVVGYYKDEYRPWKVYQQDFYKEEMRRAVTPAQKAQATRVTIGIRQILLPALNRVDRCTTCHLAVDDPSYGGMPQPLAYHPGHEQHPFEKFGCTVCHRGQGRATTVEDAHGSPPHWDEPMLPMRYIQASCGKCHEASENPAAPELARGQAVFDAAGCRGCHKLAGVGGNLGPALDRVGERRSANWLKMHFAKPSAVTPGSAMPPQKFSDHDLEAITMFMLSQTGESSLGYYGSMRVIPSSIEGRHLFEAKGCIGCHSVGGRGGKVGPALDDVGLRRTAAWIMQHFRDPQSVTPGSVMPKFGFTESESRALTDFLINLREQSVSLSLPSLLSPADRGRAVYVKYGCAGCHGKDGAGGVPNPNAITKELVPGLTLVGEGYTKAELKARIFKGQREINSLDPKRPAPPLYMPAWGNTIKDSEYDDLIAYLFSLKPKDDNTGF